MKRPLVGWVLVISGILLLADRLGYIQLGGLLHRWWPLILVATGLWHWLADRRNTGGLVLAAIGAVFLLQRFALVSWAVVGTYWPAVLILAGLVVLARRPTPPGPRRHGEGTVNLLTFLGETDRLVDAPEFRGGDILTILGSTTLDLRATTLPEAGAVVEVAVVLGDVELRVRDGWQVRLEAVSVLGGSEDRRTFRTAAPAGGPALVVRGFILLGNLQVKD